MKFTLMAFYLIVVAGQAWGSDAPLVAAASSLRHVWPQLMQAHAPETEPRVTFGSSGNLARQIKQSAPFELFLSADTAFPEDLYQQDKANDKPVHYTTGALAWVALEQSPLASWLQRIEQQPKSDIPFPTNNIQRLAIANPAFAPYGHAAEQVLDNVGIEDVADVKLSLGENAAQALQFALSGATGGGIVPLALLGGSAAAQFPPFVFSEIPASAHQPLKHSMILITKPSVNAHSLFSFLRSERAQQIFEQNGFRAVQ